MQCLVCPLKSCKSEGKDCNGNQLKLIDHYADAQIAKCYVNADALVSNGKAGHLSRIEEIVIFCRSQNYQEIGLAYCYSMESLVALAADYIVSQGLSVRSYRCTINGIRQDQIGSDLNHSVGCNPLGQAEAINQEPVDFVVEMGLCLGHDILFHQGLKKPFTVLLVKDRVYNHDPKLFLLNMIKNKAK